MTDTSVFCFYIRVLCLMQLSPRPQLTLAKMDRFPLLHLSYNIYYIILEVSRYRQHLTLSSSRERFPFALMVAQQTASGSLL